MLAAAKGSPDALQVLLSKGADTSFRNKWGESALLIAARDKNMDKVKAILVTSPDVNATDREGKTPLAAACAEGAPAELLQALFDAKADVNKGDESGVTALMRAADRGDADTVKLLLAAGAKKDLKDTNAQTAADWATNRGDEPGKACAELLK